MTFFAICVSLDTAPVVVAMAVPASNSVAANIRLSVFFIGFLLLFPFTCKYEAPVRAVAARGPENCKEFVNAQMVEGRGLWVSLKVTSMTTGRSFKVPGRVEPWTEVSNFLMADQWRLPRARARNSARP